MDNKLVLRETVDEAISEAFGIVPHRYEKEEDFDLPMWDETESEDAAPKGFKTTTESKMTDFSKMTPLEEHDYKYHDGNYEADHERNGARCLYRERKAKGDDSDAALAEADSLEAARFHARKREVINIEDRAGRILKMLHPESFSVRSALRKQCDIRATTQDKDGYAELHIWTPSTVADDLISDEDARLLAEGSANIITHGLDNNFVDFGSGWKYKGKKTRAAGGRKCFIVRMWKKERIGDFIAPEDAQRQKGSYTQIAPRREILEGRGSKLLKRYGFKIEDGKVVPRNGDLDITAAERYEKEWVKQMRERANMSNAEIKSERDAKRIGMAREQARMMEDIQNKAHERVKAAKDTERAASKARMAADKAAEAAAREAEIEANHQFLNALLDGWDVDKIF